MTTAAAEQPTDPRAALARISRDTLPSWLSQAIDVISHNAEAFPSPTAEGFEFLDHLYPH